MNLAIYISLSYFSVLISVFVYFSTFQL